MLFSIIWILFCLANILAQKTETFDIITFKTPNGWQKQVNQNAIQFGIEDSAKGTLCLVTMFKPLPGSKDSKANFEASWESVVKTLVKVSGKPEMQPAADENGWTAESGFAQYESDGKNGLVMLVTISGNSQLINIVALTNTDVYQQNITDFLESISLPKIVANNSSSSIEKAERLQPSRDSNFKFTATNFDDGWTSTEQEDWVQVTNGTTRVLIHYPNKEADKYNSILLDGLKHAWDVLVAPKYRSASNFAFRPIGSWQSVEFAEADVVEKATGKTVYVVLFKMNYSNGSGKYLEFITPNKRSFEEEFGAYHETSSGWEKMEQMANYNKFGVAASDLQGKWTNSFSGMVQYSNIYTGASAGADTHASAENFLFGSGNSYKWDIGVASGFVGNIKFQSAKSSGKFSVPNIWQVTFSDIEGKPRTYGAYFSFVKGARLLWLDTTAFGRID